MDITHLRAKTCSKCGEIKPVSEFYSDNRSTSGYRSHCKLCMSKATLIRNEVNPEKHRECVARWQSNNIERCKENNAAWQKNNPDKCAGYAVNWRSNNRELSRSNASMYQKLYPERCNANNAKRRASKLSATVSWADSSAMEQLYVEARRLFEETGVKYHVDHIVPLVHPLVCGLHWEGNLQVITETENCIKHNSFTPGIQP